MLGFSSVAKFPSDPTYHLLVRVLANATHVRLPLESPCLFKLTRLMVGVLLYRQHQPVGNAVITDRTRRQALDQVPDTIQNRHGSL